MRSAGRGRPLSPARRLGEWRERPARALGQCFLIDPNILEAVVAAARISARDVVLEVGGGLGVLSQRLAAEGAHLHVVEIDERLAEPLGRALAPFDNVTLHWGDALKLDLAGLLPRPSVLAANLPYAIAASLLVRVACELPQIERCVVMVQREVGERLASAPVPAGGGGRGQRPYGAAAALIQLTFQVRVLRAIPARAFAPVPRVQSSLLELTRIAEPASGQVRAFINGAFAHRRKSLKGSLALARPGVEVDLQRLEEALRELGYPADVRAERLSPRALRTLAEAVA
jgi:16S rRNA (adenine1518-N6/adenine1519-N6)-dimethyltransferase